MSDKSFIKINLNNIKKLVTLILILLIPITIIFAYLLGFNFYYQDKVFPNVYLENIKLSGLTSDEAKSVLENQIKKEDGINIKIDGQEFEIILSDIDYKINYDTNSNAAFNVYRTGSVYEDLKGRSLSIIKPTHIPLSVSFDENKLDESISVLAEQLSIEPVYPKVIAAKNVIEIEKGEPGSVINIGNLKKEIVASLSSASFDPIVINSEIINPSITDEEADNLRARAQIFQDKELSLKLERQSFIYDFEKLVSLLSPDGYYQREIETLTDSITSQTQRSPQNPVFKFENGKVVEFIPAVDGITVNKDLLNQDILIALKKLETTEDKLLTLDIPVYKEGPEITTGEVNDLGIKELLGVGSSTFRGSIASRIHNIGISSSQFNGVLIPPGEVFSFNKTVGDISSLTGYKQAYIIQDGKTILGDGGGVCQVSTTLFRAALDAGLPIVERSPHSYRVSYYEQDSKPGIDATIYSPTTDLKFRNDTPNHLLIQTHYDPAKATLVFEIYGTNDGRVSTISNPVITSQTPPPEPLYQDDPTLPVGQVKQIDWAAWGARVYFDYSVTLNGETIYEKTFYSNYRPWQAKYLRGTNPV